MATRFASTIEMSNSDAAPHPIDADNGSYETQELGQVVDPESMPSWRSLFLFVNKTHVPSLAFAIGATTISGCVKPASAILYGKIFTSFTKFGMGALSPQQTLHQIATWCIALACLGGVAWAIEAAFFSSWVIFGESQARDVRLRMFDGMLNRPIEWYDMRQDGIGTLLVRIQTQIRELQLALSQPLGFLVFEIVGLLVSIGLAFYYSWQLALVIFGTFPFVAALLYLISRKLGSAIEAQKRRLTEASKYANTAITNINTVKAYNGQAHEIWQYSETIKAAATEYIIQAQVNSSQFAIIKIVTVALFVEGFGFGLYLVNNGTNPGHILTTFYACLTALQSIETVLPQWLVLTKGMSAGATLEGIMSHLRNGRKVTSMTGSYRPNRCQGDIEVNNVTFNYPMNPQQKALDNATFFFPANETTFIVGSSGSGKSTLGNLIMKYYEPSRGQILLDGKSLKTIDPEWLRQNVTLVQQDSVLFNETIRQNIAFGRDELPSDEEITSACQTADLAHTIRELPKGLETVAGAGGQGLSGGQQQRVVIARARLRDSPILILDEATSALDKKSRENVMAAIRVWRKGKTTIMITHDVSQIRDGEYVYVMQNGTSVQEGYREKLAKKQFGAFADLLAAASANTPVLQERRASTPSTPAKPSFDDVFHPAWTSSSRPFGMPNSSPRIGAGVGVRGSLMMGIGALQGQSLWSQTNWASPASLGSSNRLSTFSPKANDVLVELSDFGARRNSILLDLPPPSPTKNRFSWNPQNLARRNSVLLPTLGRSFSVKRTETAQALGFKPRILEAAAESQLHIIEEQVEPESESQFIIAPTKDNLRRPASVTSILRSVWPNLDTPHRFALICAFVAAMIHAAATPTFAYLFTQLLSVYYTSTGRGHKTLVFVLSLLAVGIIDGFCVYTLHLSFEWCGQCWVDTLRLKALKKILAQPRAWFDKERNTAANLNTYLDRNVEEMRNLVGRFLGPIYTLFWVLAITIVWSMIISWKLTLVAMAFVPVMYALTQVFEVVSAYWETKCNDGAERTGGIFTETFANIRVVRALTLENFFKNKHERSTLETYKIGQSRGLWACVFFGSGDTMTFALTAVMFYYGAVLITSGETGVTAVLGVVNLLTFGIAGVLGYLSLIPQLSSSQSAASTILHLANLDSGEALGNRKLKTPFPVVLDQMSFTYPLQFVPTLNNISFKIESGTCTGIVGSSGSGKSTLIALLLGLYTPDEVSFDRAPPLSFADVAITDYDLNSLRSQIAVVAQKPLLFPTSVTDNIIYGLPKDSKYLRQNVIEQAAKDAGIHDFIMGLPDGYSTQIGEGGQGISGGQAQRIVIARALVRQPAILILDEATSALDAISAAAIRATIRLLVKRGVAVVMISHAVEMMRVCDHLVMLEHGKVVEMGKFDELKKNGGAFADLIGVKKEEKVEQSVKGLGIGNLTSPVERRNKIDWYRKTSV